MIRRFFSQCGPKLLATIVLLAAAADASAGGWPYNPQLIVPTPIVRRHACGKDCSVVRKRGIAILSPVESPDAYNPPVGGKTIYTNYYPDYCPHRHHGPRVCIPGNGFGYMGPCAGVGVPGVTVPGLDETAVDSNGYGNFSGARQDEKNLSHLGGFYSPDPAAEPTTTTPDLIDELEGRVR